MADCFTTRDAKFGPLERVDPQAFSTEKAPFPFTIPSGVGGAPGHPRTILLPTIFHFMILKYVDFIFLEQFLDNRKIEQKTQEVSIYSFPFYYQHLH